MLRLVLASGHFFRARRVYQSDVALQFIELISDAKPYGWCECRGPDDKLVEWKGLGLAFTTKVKIGKKKAGR